MSEKVRRHPDTKMVPVPTNSIVPERDINEIPVLETRHLGIEFGSIFNMNNRHDSVPPYFSL